VLDAALDVGVVSFAVWTAVHALMLVGLPFAPGVAAWGLVTLALVVWRTRGPWLARGLVARPSSTLVALVGSTGVAALSSVLVRPDADDAFYVLRATWTADHGAVPTGDFLFSDGSWPALYYIHPDFQALDSLQGAVAWMTGVATGSVVYRWFVPLATFAAAWALWRLLRSWGARRPATSFVVAGVMLLWGGAVHASFGNLSLVRIWQGKAVFVTLLVPYLWVVFASLWASRDRRAVRSGLLVALAGGVAGIGLSNAAVFVMPLAAVAAGAALLVARRPWAGLSLVAAISVGPFVNGLAIWFAPGGRTGNVWYNDYGIITPWRTVLASVPLSVVVALAGIVVVTGGWWSATRVVGPDQRRPLAVAVVVALLATMPPLFHLVEIAIGGDMVSWRTAWLLPVPALVGLLASLPVGKRWLAGLPAVVVSASLIVTGLPVWSASNWARLASPGTWKLDMDDLDLARWVVDRRPTGTFLAPVRVVVATGVVSSGPRPVGNREGIPESMREVPGSHVDQRNMLQALADGRAVLDEDSLPAARQALDDLEVSLACLADSEPATSLLTSAGFEPVLVTERVRCWVRR